MKTALSVILCKILSAVGKLVGKGTSLPGKVVLRFCPDILKRIELPKVVIAVTGSNGKTSTSEMIAHILRENSMTVATNKEGSNQIEGVTTLLLKNCTLGGKVKADAAVLESDERYAKRTFSYFTPDIFAVTNIYRDQLTRNVHPEWMYRIIKDSIPNGSKLILNADDPLVTLIGRDYENAVYFGMNRNEYSSENPTGVYNDAAYCPCCAHPLEYDYYHFSDVGKFKCPNCGFKSPETDFAATSVELDEKYIIVNEKYRINLAFASRFNVYNILTAFAVCSVAGVDGNKIAESLSDFVMKNGRVVRFSAGENEGVLLTSKHENSVSYNQSIEYVTRRKGNCDVYIIIDQISRKYFTGETSWIWDIDFGALNSSNISGVFLCGKYAYDLAYRFSFTDVPKEKISVMPDLDAMGEKLREKTENEIYVITCFSDKDKLLARVRALTPTAK